MNSGRDHIYGMFCALELNMPHYVQPRRDLTSSHHVGPDLDIISKTQTPKQIRQAQIRFGMKTLWYVSHLVALRKTTLAVIIQISDLIQALLCTLTNKARNMHLPVMIQHYKKAATYFHHTNPEEDKICNNALQLICMISLLTYPISR